MPNDPHGRTAPLRYDNRNLKYCDICRERLGLAAELREVSESGKKSVSAHHREALKKGQREFLERRGYVKCYGLLKIKLDSGKSYEEIAAACGDGYSLHKIRGWAVGDTQAPLSKLPRVAEVLNCTVDEIVGVQ